LSAVRLPARPEIDTAQLRNLDVEEGIQVLFHDRPARLIDPDDEVVVRSRPVAEADVLDRGLLDLPQISADRDLLPAAAALEERSFEHVEAVHVISSLADAPS